jgi:L-methionine (R)-S-oxide reductase
MNVNRMARYERIYDQLKALISDKSSDLIAAMATICAVLHAKMPHQSWTGFYLVSDENELHVGPYQGPVACQVLRDSGTCLHAVRTKQPVVVPDVSAFPGHVPCDPRSKSEIVIPVLKGNEVIAVLDIDSHERSQFSEGDIAPLAKILGLLRPYL